MTEGMMAMSNFKPLRVGLIGLGKMGQNHLRVLSMLKTVELIFVYDTSQDHMKSCAEKYNIKPSIDLMADLLLVDAVIIATPTSTHFEYIKIVSDYVKNIFVEKPLTDSMNTTEEVKKLAESKDLNIQVGFIERFNPAVIEFRKILKHSNKVLNVDFTRTNKLSNRIQDVDVIIDLMIHDIDLALFLNGDVESVFAYGTIEENMISFASAIIKHKNGVFSRITASRVTEKRIRQISATCEDMYIDCNLLKKEILLNKQSVLQSYEYMSLASVEEAVNVPTQEALLSEMICFVNNCLQREPDSITPGIHAALDSIIVAKQIKHLIKGEKYEMWH